MNKCLFEYEPMKIQLPTFERKNASSNASLCSSTTKTEDLAFYADEFDTEQAGICDVL